MLDKILHTIKKLIPKRLFATLQPAYHYALAFAGALIYRFPSREIFVLGITGTKGKSSTAEITNAILEEAGYKTGMVNGIRFKVGDVSVPNRLKMTMPGRFLIQKYMRKAVRSGCTHFILEMTSEGTKQFRHKWIDLDTLIFTNLSPEHIESHGSYEKYVEAKLSIGHELAHSKKPERTIIANGDDDESEKFLALPVDRKISYSLDDVKLYRAANEGSEMTFRGERISSPLSGEINIYNMLAAATFAESIGVPQAAIKKALEAFSNIPGRVERIREGQNFDVIVDYAHTADSLEKFYKIFKGKDKVCVLGSTGGGRDKWKRKEMGAIADKYCEHVILTNEDPYDEDPMTIIEDVAEGIQKKKPTIILSRREAIAKAIQVSHKGSVVLITGKGTDPYIMEADGGKTPWSDAEVAREELRKHLEKHRR